MPLVQVKVIEGVFTEAQKREIVRRLTDAMVSIEGESLRPLTVVLVEEVKSGDWGVGGKAFTTADVKELAGVKRRAEPRAATGRASLRHGLSRRRRGAARKAGARAVAGGAARDRRRAR